MAPSGEVTLHDAISLFSTDQPISNITTYQKFLKSALIPFKTMGKCRNGLDLSLTQALTEYKAAFGHLGNNTQRLY